MTSKARVRYIQAKPKFPCMNCGKPMQRKFNYLPQGKVVDVRLTLMKNEESGKAIAIPENGTVLERSVDICFPCYSDIVYFRWGKLKQKKKWLK